MARSLLRATGPNLFSIKWNPFLKVLESDPRYKSFLKKINLPE
jgi:hypothetical protein